MKYKNNEQGITLVALIVTIIVLLILSGITIASFKQSNIITKAKDSAKRYSASQINEKIDLAQQDLIIDRASYNYSIKDLVDELQKENDSIVAVKVDENNEGRNATYIIDEHFYEFTKKDDGIIIYNRKAEASDEEKKKYENKKELKNLKSGVITFKNDKTDWTNENVNVTIVAKTEDKSIQEKIDNGTYFVVSTVNDATKLTTLTKSITSQVATNQGDTIYACLTDGYGTYVATATEKIDNIDKTKPTDTAPTAMHTTNSITATNNQEDKPGTTETKASGIAKTEYSKDGGKTWQASNVFSGLKQNAAYTIKTRVTDKAGNVTESQTLSVTTGTINAVGKASATPTTLTSGDVTVTLPTLTGFTTKYTTNGAAPSTGSATYTGPFTVSSNCTVLYVYTDGTNINSAGSLGITNIDKTAYTITYNLNGGSISGQPTTYKVDTANITLPTPTRTGYTFNGWTGSNGTTAQTSVTIAKGSRGNKTYTANWTLPPLPTTTNYTGCYADVNDDGTVDGVIFIDLAQGASGRWGYDGDYSYSAVTSGLRSYKISTIRSSYTDEHFKTKPVIAPNGESGKDRFYVMTLSDLDTSSAPNWYDACKKTQTVGSVTFKLPSKEEWSAFGGQFGITKENYSSTYGLSLWYWSSTNDGSSSVWNAWRADFDDGRMYGHDKTNAGYVRLCATF